MNRCCSAVDYALYHPYYEREIPCNISSKQVQAIGEMCLRLHQARALPIIFDSGGDGVEDCHFGGVAQRSAEKQ